ncbi:MAG: transglycosylase SLT domain-containing protein [Alloprevotella sp.]|nr:transglycosylase SLT domain-containing protein [Alloprevotella sp.]
MRRIHSLLLACAALFPASLSAQEEIVIHDRQLDQDEVFTLPEGLTVSEDALLSEWQAKNYLFPDTTCENPNYNPTYAPEVYRERLLRLPTVIEMTYNDVVQGFIDRYTNRQRRAVAAMLGTANLYVPMFEEALDYYGLPLELKYLPVIESALNPNAVSPAGAAGLWQMMLSTGKQYNLEVNSRVDERRDPIKSTWAAARLLRDLFKIYGDWHLVLAAYNCGPGNVNKAIHRAGEQRNYWKIYPYLPKETRGYVPAFIAANYIMNYYCDHNICPMRTRYPIQTDTIMVSHNVDLNQVAEICRIDLDVVKALNPQYRTRVVPGYSTPSTIRLPQEAIATFIAQQDVLYSRDGVESPVYEAGQQELAQGSAAALNGDRDLKPAVMERPASAATRTVSRPVASRPSPRPAPSRPTAPARRGKAVAPANGRTHSKAVPPATKASARGTKNSRSAASSAHSAPAKKSTARTAAKGKSSKTTATKKAAPTETTVKKGQTLSQIAAKNNTTVSNLKKKNGLKGDKIRPGQKIKVK